MSEADASVRAPLQGREESALIPRPDTEWERVRWLVLDALPSPHSRRVYSKALDEFRLWAAHHASEGFTKAAVQRYRAYLETLTLAPSTINVRLTAVRKLAQEAADNGLLTGSWTGSWPVVSAVSKEHRRRAAGSETGLAASRRLNS